MEGLRPERDELDQFKHRATRGSKKKGVPPVVKPVAEKPRSSAGLWAVIILLLGVCGALGFGVWQQQESLAQLTKQINDTEGFVGQSKLLMARLEGELNETGAEIEQSGSAVERKLDFLDSEMRKLWGVSNDRNKKAIQANDAAIAGLEERIAQLVSSQKAFKNNLLDFEDKVAKQMAGVSKQVSAMDNRVAVAASEASIVREATSEELKNLREKLKGMESAQSVAAENAKAIESINASRRQLNERVVDLERQLNQLRLQMEGGRPGPVVQ